VTIEIALALVAFSAPITAAIVKLVPRRAVRYADRGENEPHTPYLTTREFDNFRSELSDRITEIKMELAYIKDHIH
jgi:C-terminal processing protease CtpA/Prc